jgi:hypothetical protein
MDLLNSFMIIYIKHIIYFVTIKNIWKHVIQFNL